MKVTIVQDLLQPWKLTTFMLGMGLLIAGADYFGIPDWDVGVCFYQGIPTYLTAGWAMRQFIARKSVTNVLAACLFLWFSVDTSYTIYWGTHDPIVLLDFRVLNDLVSSSLYLAYGLILYPQGSLKDMLGSLRNTLANSPVTLK